MKRTWRAATAGLATATLLTMTAVPASAQLGPLEGLLGPILDLLPIPGGDGDGPGLPGLPGLPGGDEDGEPGSGPSVPTTRGQIPETGMGGFAGYARAAGTTVFIGLPPALDDGLSALTEGLGIRGQLETSEGVKSGIRIDLTQAQADLERAAAGEEITSEAAAFVTNLLLASDLAGQPGACTGGPTEINLPPGDGTPLIALTLLGVDCEETDERAFASAQIAGLDIRLGALLELGLPDALADGLDTLIETLNEALLAPVSDGLCSVLDPILGIVLPGAEPCEDGTPLLQLRNPLDLDVPVVDLDLIRSTSEVVQTGDTITATATSLFTGVNVLGVACVGNATGPLEFTATATSDGTTATREASAPSLTVGLCQNEQSLVRILLGDGPLGDIGLIERIVQDDLLDGALQAVFDGIDTLLDTLTTQALTQGQPILGDIDGAGTTAGTSPFVAVGAIPLAGLPGLDEILGDLAVFVVAGETQVGVNAQPAGAPPVEPPDDPDPTDPERPAPRPLPRTGMGLGLLVGLGALGAAAALRRRED